MNIPEKSHILQNYTVEITGIVGKQSEKQITQNIVTRTLKISYNPSKNISTIKKSYWILDMKNTAVNLDLTLKNA